MSYKTQAHDFADKLTKADRDFLAQEAQIQEARDALQKAEDRLAATKKENDPDPIMIEVLKRKADEAKLEITRRMAFRDSIRKQMERLYESFRAADTRSSGTSYW